MIQNNLQTSPISGVRWSSVGISVGGTGVQNHLPPFQNLGNFIHPTLPVSFGRDTKSSWSLLPGVYASGSKRSHTGGKCVTSRGLKEWWSLFLTHRFPECERRRAGLITLLRNPDLDRKKKSIGITLVLHCYQVYTKYPNSAINTNVSLLH